MKEKNILYYIVFVSLLTLYLRESIISESLRNLAIVSSYSNYYVLVLMLLCIVYLFTNKQNKVYTSPFYILKSNIIIIFLISLFWSLFNPLPSYSLYIKIILPLFILFFSFNIAKSIGDKVLFYSLNFLMLIVLLITYFQYYTTVLYLSTNDQIVTNSSYFLLYILPVVLCTKKKIFPIIAIVVVTVAILLSAKRGGTIAILTALIVYFLVEYIFIKKTNKHSRLLLFVTIFIIIVVYVFNKIIASDLLIVNRMIDISDSGGSGRDIVWAKTLEMIKNSNFAYLLFGHGFNQVLVNSPVHLSAHNDFLEIIYDFGVFTFFLYLCFHFQFINRIIIMVRQKSKFAAPFAASYVIFLITSMIAHVFIYPHYFIINAFVWGSILGLYASENKQNNKITSQI